MAELLSAADLPEGFDYPSQFVRVVELGLTNLEPWHILEGPTLHARLNGLRERFPDRELVPFARRQDNDDVACLDIRQPLAVLVVHDFSGPGWGHVATFPDFAAWLRQAVQDLLDFE